MLPSNVQQDTTTNTLYENERPPTSKAWRNDVYEALEQAGMATIAERWLSCSDKFVTRLKPAPDAKLPLNAEKVFVCSGNHHHEAQIYSQSCDLRICPDCARMHSARLVARYLPKCQELMHDHKTSFRFRTIVFTTPHVLTDPEIRKKLLCGFKQVYRVMNKLMSTRGNWKNEQGFLVTSEFGETGKHLHYHIIHYGQYLQQSELSRAWSEATDGAASVVFVRGFPYIGLTVEQTLKETLKYATKFYNKDKATGVITHFQAELMPVLAEALRETRRVRAYGVFYNLPEPVRADHLCDTCQAPMVAIPVDYFVTFCNTGFLPLEWQNARTDALLNLKPADKSLSQSSGIPPPDPIGERKRQMLMSQIEKIRVQRKDDW